MTQNIIISFILAGLRLDVYLWSNMILNAIFSPYLHYSIPILSRFFQEVKKKN